MLARLLTIAAATACVLAFFLAPSAIRAGFATAGLAVSLFTFCPRRKNRAEVLLIDSRNAARCRIDNEVIPLTFEFCSAGYACLRSPGRALRLPIWPDSLPTGAWRRLQVAGRWPREESAAAAVDEGDRT